MDGSSHSYHRALHCLADLRTSSDEMRDHWFLPYFMTEALRISSCQIAPGHSARPWRNTTPPCARTVGNQADAGSRPGMRQLVIWAQISRTYLSVLPNTTCHVNHVDGIYIINRMALHATQHPGECKRSAAGGMRVGQNRAAGAGAPHL